MKIHILGICGTFMGSIALLARALGHEVSGSDENVYPPMSTQLAEHGISLIEGYDPAHLDPVPDLVIIGNALSRGNSAVEHVLNKGLSYISGPQWLNENVLQGRHVFAVAGTHGKTTTAAMLSWILDVAGLKPGFLIGGIAENFLCSARLGNSDYFVVEADEYDTAFFDKRSKFIHYRPHTLIINNIEFDHADIFNDLGAIRREFHHLVRLIPEQGMIIAHHGDQQIDEVLDMGCWSSVEYFADDAAKWNIRPLADDFSEFEVLVDGELSGKCQWQLIGQHNAENALAAIAAAAQAGITSDKACEALAGFKSVKRRLEQLAVVNNITVYDDFAHHPTAIQATLKALRQSIGDKRIIAIFEPRSNTMRQGIHKDDLAASLVDADHSMLFQPEGLVWDLTECTKSLGDKRQVFTDIESIINETVSMAHNSDHIIIMSNGGFGGIHTKLIERLQSL
ncbi:MAG: UDP-N-acetylmuramate:L-alanyl-gamma-D-glutamyl-meso-diaminopimelate ligase [Gammaproteobacteria bacterium]